MLDARRVVQKWQGYNTLPFKVLGLSGAGATAEAGTRWTGTGTGKAALHWLGEVVAADGTTIPRPRPRPR